MAVVFSSILISVIAGVVLLIAFASGLTRKTKSNEHKLQKAR